MKKPITDRWEFWIVAIGLPIVIVVLVVLSLSRRSERHTYWASCDGRGPYKYCEDYYKDEPSEVECTEPVELTSTRCDRSKVIGGCRGKTMIRWLYEGSTDSAATSKKCSSGEWVPADWEEVEEK